MASDAKEAFTDAYQRVDHHKDPVTYSLLAGLIRLAEQVADMDHRLRQIESEVRSLPR